MTVCEATKLLPCGLGAGGGSTFIDCIGASSVCGTALLGAGGLPSGDDIFFFAFKHTRRVLRHASCKVIVYRGINVLPVFRKRLLRRDMKKVAAIIYEPQGMPMRKQG